MSKTLSALAAAASRAVSSIHETSGRLSLNALLMPAIMCSAASREADEKAVPTRGAAVGGAGVGRHDAPSAGLLVPEVRARTLGPSLAKARPVWKPSALSTRPTHCFHRSGCARAPLSTW